MGRSWFPSVLSSGCSLTPRGGGFPGHIHPDFDEICLVANEPTVIRHGGVERRAVPGTLFLFRRGELHGYRNDPEAEPHLWLVHFKPDEDLYGECPVLADPDPERRVWRLDQERQAVYQGLFVRLQAEVADPQRVGAAAGASAWLRLILLAAARWAAGLPAPATPPAADPELMALWELVNEHVEHPADLPGAIRRRVPTYDAVRHRFRRAFGTSPRELLGRLRLERARHLLLESELAIGDVAERLGYVRVQEFSRAFRAQTGLTPQAFRRNPR